MNNRTKYILMRHLALVYRKNQEKVHSIWKCVGKVDNTEQKEFIDFFESLAMHLNEDEKLIFRHEFLSPCKRNWWDTYFSKSNYYRHRVSLVKKLFDYTYQQY
ncbi:MAG: MG284/MPN403 family protein [Erysipelotrichaceae bacterium]